jgi:hypothetical protein
MSTHLLTTQLNQYSGTGIIELLNVCRFYEEIKKDFPPEYWLDCNFILEALDLASNISEVNLALAPFPSIDIADTQAGKAAKVADTWRAYPRIGLQLHIDPGTGRWIKKGQPIVIQNTPVQFPVPLISPYLNTTASVFLIGRDTRIGISIVTGNLWQPIKGEDFITISGALRVDIQPKELKSIPIRSWISINKSLLANQPTKVLVYRPNRRYLSIINAGVGDIFCGFGSDIINRGNLITPKGSLNLDSERYYTDAELWAFSPNVEGVIVGQEGLI